MWILVYILFWMSIRIGLHALVLQKHISFVKRQCHSSVFLLHLKRSVLAPVSLRDRDRSPQSALIGQLTDIWASNMPAVLNQF